MEGTLQQVEGVVWCQVTAFGRFASGVIDPASLVLPAAPRPRAAQLACAENELLQLLPIHLSLGAAPAPPTGDCS